MHGSPTRKRLASTATSALTCMRPVNYKSTIARLLKEQKFQELDYLADRARSGKRKISWRELETRQSGVFLESGAPPSLPCIELEWGPVKRIVKSTASK